MKAILIALIFMCGLAVFVFGGSLPSNFHELRTGSFELEFKPMINLGAMFKGQGERKLPKPY